MTHDCDCGGPHIEKRKEKPMISAPMWKSKGTTIYTPDGKTIYAISSKRAVFIVNVCNAHKPLVDGLRTAVDLLEENGRNPSMVEHLRIDVLSLVEKNP